MRPFCSPMRPTKKLETPLAKRHNKKKHSNTKNGLHSLMTKRHYFCSSLKSEQILYLIKQSSGRSFWSNIADGGTTEVNRASLSTCVEIQRLSNSNKLEISSHYCSECASKKPVSFPSCEFSNGSAEKNVFFGPLNNLWGVWGGGCMSLVMGLWCHVLSQ